MLGIYVGLPLVFITLAVCIGIVEYRPIDPAQSQRAHAEKQRMIDRVGMERQAERLAADGYGGDARRLATPATGMR